MDRFQNVASHESFFGQTLPPFATTRRWRESGTRRSDSPDPGGVITVHGPPAGPVDVTIETRNGRFFGYWPRPEAKPHRLSWKRTELAAEADELKELPDDHWFERLRGGEALYVTADRATERFFYYDAEFSYRLPLRLDTAGDDAYRVTVAGSSPAHGITIFKPAGDGWRTGTVERLPLQAEGEPATRPSVLERETVVALGPPQPAEAALAPWRSRMREEGLAEAQVEAAMASLAAQALHPRRLTVVYRLDRAEMDRLLPLKVAPAPRKVTRVALMVVSHLDPAMSEQIDALIAQLGDASWASREEAQAQLIRLGPAARSQLDAAARHDDPEIATRAERIQDAIKRGPAPRQSGAEPY